MVSARYQRPAYGWSFSFPIAADLCFLKRRDKAAPVAEAYLAHWFGDDWLAFAEMDQTESNNQNSQRRFVLFPRSK